jgi:hypothetical protein
MNPKSKESKEALARFNEHVSKLRGDDLLDLKIAFDRLPPAEESERNLRRAQGYTANTGQVASNSSTPDVVR